MERDPEKTGTLTLVSLQRSKSASMRFGLGRDGHYAAFRWAASKAVQVCALQYVTEEGLSHLGCGDIDPSAAQRLDSIDRIPALERIRRAVTKRQVDPSHFNFGIFQL
jgi:hypothetical protein